MRGSRGWCVIWLPWLLVLVGCRPADEKPPYIIVVSIDTLNRDALRAFAKTAGPLPNLDRFAAEGVRFKNAYSTASWTLPAHASVLTGLYPDRHGANRETFPIRSGVGTIAEAIRSVGYETIAFVGGGYLHRRYGFSRGFDRYEDQPKKVVERATDKELKKENSPPGKDPFGRAIAFLAGRPAGAGPLFLFLHTYAVHQYFRVHEWAVARLAEASESYGSYYLACLDGSRQCSAQDWDRMRALYQAELEHLDEAFGRLVEALQRADLWERSVVFFLSDHGEGFDFERGRIHHGGRLHADQLRVPLIVRVPGQASRDEMESVSLVDLMPTILELSGAAPVVDLDGRSFARVLRGESIVPGSRPLYAMEHNYTWGEDGVRAVIRGPGRLPCAVAVIQGPHWYIRGLWSDELYDMRADGSQRWDLSEEADLDGYRQLLGTRSKWRADSKPIELDAELLDQLRSLGYSE